MKGKEYAGFLYKEYQICKKLSLLNVQFQAMFL